MSRLIAIIIMLLIFLVTVTFVARNAHINILLDYYFDRIEINLSVLLVITLATGMGLGIIFNLIWVWNLWLENHRLKKQLKSIPRQTDNEHSSSTPNTSTL